MHLVNCNHTSAIQPSHECLNMDTSKDSLVVALRIADNVLGIEVGIFILII